MPAETVRSSTGTASAETIAPTSTAETTPPASTVEPTANDGPTSGRPLEPSPTPRSVSATPSPPAVATTILSDPPERDLYQLAAELKLTGREKIQRVVNSEPVSYAEGREDTFWLVDLSALEVYSSRFGLRLVTPHAYWYFEEDQSVSQNALERAATTFEEEIYPKVTAVFGEEWTPGVDNDPHLNILNARLNGVGGYYSSSDEYPLSVSNFSNQREIIYINTGAVPVGSPFYLEVLAHELQHAVHWNADASEETWVNEGLAELAITIAGFGPGNIELFLRSRPTSLIHWPLTPFWTGPYYGGSSLFMHYLVEHYGDRNDLRPLLEEPENGITGVTAYLKTSGHDATFRDVFRDWAVANLLDEPQGPYGYADLEVQGQIGETITGFSDFTSQIPQYAVEYVELESFEGPLRLSFYGPTENRLLQAEVDSRGCWWSNSGDSINSTLTRELDLRGLDRATLAYQIWYDVEESWDYGYMEVSGDGGTSWDILGAPNTTAKNPIGNSFGMGYTGASEGWIEESVDLSAYSGRRVLMRFQYVTDDAINGPGLCVRGVSIPEAGLSDLKEGWDAAGFVLTDNKVKQEYIVQVVQVGEETQVTELSLNKANQGGVVILDPQTLDRLVVVVAALAPKTRQPATYTLTVEPAN